MKNYYLKRIDELQTDVGERQGPVKLPRVTGAVRRAFGYLGFRKLFGKRTVSSNTKSSNTKSSSANSSSAGTSNTGQLGPSNPETQQAKTETPTQQNLTQPNLRTSPAAKGSLRKKEPRKPGISDEEKYQRETLGRAELEQATADVAARAKGRFSQGVDDSRSDKEAMHKAIARRERKTGKKINLTDKQALDLSHRVYSRMGYVLAESLGLL